jgi:hypothetical protein
MSKVEIGNFIGAEVSHIWSQDNTSNNFEEIDCSEISYNIYNWLAGILTLSNYMLDV